MSYIFFSPKTLITDRGFLKSLFVSLIFVTGVSAAATYFLAQRRISVEPITQASFVPKSELDMQPEPFSKIINAIAADSTKSGTAEVYVANLEELCHSRMPDNMKQLVIVQTRDRAIVGRTLITPATCTLLKRLGSNDAIYAASDKPLPNVQSQRKYVALGASALGLSPLGIDQ